MGDEQSSGPTDGRNRTGRHDAGASRLRGRLHVQRHASARSTTPTELPDWFPPASPAPTRSCCWCSTASAGSSSQAAPPPAAVRSRSMDGTPDHHVAPTTTATALTSITTGVPPGEHGVIGYRMCVGATRSSTCLRWTTSKGDARQSIPPASIQHDVAFERPAPAGRRAGRVRDTGFTEAHLGGTRFVGVPHAVDAGGRGRAPARPGEPFVYAYYDGIDKVAHEYGLGDHYDAELVAVDRMVEYLVEVLPAGAALVVTADHGQVDVGDRVVRPHPEVLSHVRLPVGRGPVPLAARRARRRGRAARRGPASTTATWPGCVSREQTHRRGLVRPEGPAGPAGPSRRRGAGGPGAGRVRGPGRHRPVRSHRPPRLDDVGRGARAAARRPPLSRSRRPARAARRRRVDSPRPGRVPHVQQTRHRRRASEPDAVTRRGRPRRRRPAGRPTRRMESAPRSSRRPRSSASARW